MTDARQPEGVHRTRAGVAWALAAAIAAVFVAANAHLVVVATVSQPDCVAHVKVPTEGAAGYRAAKSSC